MSLTTVDLVALKVAQNCTSTARMLEGKFYGLVREKLGISVKNMAPQIGMHPDTLQKYERGDPISRAKLVRYACQQYLRGHFDVDGTSIEFELSDQLEDIKIRLKTLAGEIQFESEQIEKGNDDQIIEMISTELSKADESVATAQESIRELLARTVQESAYWKGFEAAASSLN